MSGTGGSAGALAARLALDTQGFNAAMTASGNLSERELARIQRQVRFVTDYIREMSRSQSALAQSNSMAQATQQMARYGQAAELSAKQLLRANQMLPAQISDIWVSLASGQNPALVLIQQGAQIRDMYGGVGNALKNVAALFNPFRLASLGSAAALGAVAVATSQAQNEQSAFAKSIITTGGAAAATADQLSSMAKEAAKASGGTRGQAASVVTALVQEGVASRAQLVTLTQAAIMAERYLSIETEKTIQAFAALGKEPIKAVEELNRKLNFLTLEQVEQIKTLTEQKNTIVAAAIAQEAYAKAVIDRSKEVRENLGTLQVWWVEVGKASKEAWDFMLGIGRQETLGEKLDRVKQAGADASKTGWWDFRNEHQRKAQVQDLKDSEDAIREQMRMAQRAATSREEMARRVREAAAAAANPPKPKKEPDDMYAGMSAFERYRLAEYRYYAQTRVEAEEQALKEMEEARRDAWEIEKKGIVQRYKDEVEAAGIKRERASPTRDQAIGNYLRQAAEQAKDVQQQVNREFQLLEDGIINFAKTGKLQFDDLFSFMAETFLLNVIRMAAAKYMLDASGNFIGWGSFFSGIFGGGSGAGGGGTPHATGLDYVPRDGYHAILHRGERVQTAAEASMDRSGGRSGVVVDMRGQVLNVGAGVSRPEMAAALARNNAAVEQRMRRLSREGVF